MQSLAAAESISRRHELHGLQPVLPVANVNTSAAFFKRVLGFEIDFLYGTPPVHGRVKAGDGSDRQTIFIHLRQAQPEAIHPCGELRIHVGRDLDALCNEYIRRGGTHHLTAGNASLGAARVRPARAQWTYLPFLRRGVGLRGAILTKPV